MFADNLITTLKKQFAYYKLLANKTIDQVPRETLFWQPDAESNSIAIIMKHMAGNMLSRWTDFMTTDGEKPWRNRDQEFVANPEHSEDLILYWNRGWHCLEEALDTLDEQTIMHIIYIRNEGHTVLEAMLRQLAHYSYHVGQIVFLGKMIQQEKWQSLSIPKGQSLVFNDKKFGEEKSTRHFTDDFLEEKK